MKLLCLILLLVLSVSPLRAQLSVSGNVVRFTDTSNNLITAGDNVNNALRVNLVAGSAGNSAASATGAAVPANADYQGINVGGTLRGATGVNPSGTVFAQQMDLASIAGATVLTGNGTAAGSLRVTIASDNTAFSVNAIQSGVWTVQPGNTVNTTPWYIKTVPSGGCSGFVADDVSTVQVATGAGTAVTAVDSCVTSIFVNNITNSSCTFRLSDKAGTPVIWVGGATDFTITPNSNARWQFDGAKFTAGIQAIAGTSSCLNLRYIGVH